MTYQAPKVSFIGNASTLIQGSSISGTDNVSGGSKLPQVFSSKLEEN